MIAILEVMIGDEEAEPLVRGLEDMNLAVRTTNKDSEKQLIIVDREQFGEEAIDWLSKLGIFREIGR